MPDKNKPNGASEYNSAKADKPGLSLISNEQLLQIYAAMVRYRALEERPGLSARWSGPNRAGDGRRWEAGVVGATIGLVRGDTIAPPNVRLLADLAKGVSARTFPKLLAGVTGHGIRRRSDAAGPESAIRAAKIRKAERKSKMVVAFAEVEETGLPTWRRSLAFAVRQKLPIVFVVQFRRQPMAAHDQRQPGIEDHRHPVAVAGLPVMVVDGDDAVAVFRVASESIMRARRGRGPTLIECRPFVLEKQVNGREPSRRADPIVNMETYLRCKGLFTLELRQRIETAFAAELDADGAVARQPSC